MGTPSLLKSPCQMDDRWQFEFHNYFRQSSLDTYTCTVLTCQLLVHHFRMPFHVVLTCTFLTQDPKFLLSYPTEFEYSILPPDTSFPPGTRYCARWVCSVGTRISDHTSSRTAELVSHTCAHISRHSHSNDDLQCIAPISEDTGEEECTSFYGARGCLDTRNVGRTALCTWVEPSHR